MRCDWIEAKEKKKFIGLIAEGHTNAKIAELLFLSSHTVTTHRKNIMHKLGVRNTAGIVMYAVKSGHREPQQVSVFALTVKLVALYGLEGEMWIVL